MTVPSDDTIRGLAVVECGPFATIQDFGRFGWQRFGISASGAMDPVAMALANTLVGNDDAMAVIEMALLGATFRAEVPCRIALTGAEGAVSIDGSPAESWRAYDLPEGAILKIGAARTGMRFYLAVAGGFDLPPVLGSLSTHTRSELGGFEGRPLRAGDRLPLARLDAAAGAPLVLPADRRPPAGGDIRVVLGPQADAFTEAGLETFLSATYVMSDRADRMGCELDGPVVEHRDGFNIVSDGIMNGSVQVPGHGRPIVLLADRQSTGGYPKIATVIEPDLPRLAQRRPGEPVRFVAVAAVEAEDAAIRHRAAVAEMCGAVTEVVTGAAALTSERLLAANLVSGAVSAFADPFADGMLPS